MNVYKYIGKVVYASPQRDGNNSILIEHNEDDCCYRFSLSKNDADIGSIVVDEDAASIVSKLISP